MRVALPLTDVRHQLQTVLTATVTALGARAGRRRPPSPGCFRSRISQRVRLIAQVAQRYDSGDLTPPHLGFGDDELGTVARALDESVQEVGRRLGEQARDRARMEAILAGMVEGVIVVDAQGRLQLVNDAARQMLKLDATSRSAASTSKRSAMPAIAELVAGVLLGPHAGGAAAVAAARPVARRSWPRAAPAAGAAEHGVILVLHDITDLRRADQIRRDFVANVSHELRTPLTAIRGYVEALSEGDADEDERAAIPGDHRAGRRSGWSGWSRICCGWRASTPARRRSTWSPATRACSSRASSTTSSRPPRNAVSASR